MTLSRGSTATLRQVPTRSRPLKRIMFVFGTRPEAVKLAPVIHAVRASQVLDSFVVVTAQHRSMLDQVTTFFGIAPDADLGVMKEGQTLAGLAGRAMQGLDKLLTDARPDAVVVQGDTTSTVVGALSAFYHRIPVVHVEAGLRTFDRDAPYPEEVNRQITTRLTDLHLTPTAACRRHLLDERVADADIVVTGNTVIDALQWALTQRSPYGTNALNVLDERPGKVLLVTAHRRESWGPAMHAIGSAIARIASLEPELTVVLPMHMNPVVRATLLPLLQGKPNVIITPPQPYGSFCRLMQRSTLVLTDSGGLQEEAPALCKPVLVMRDTTERVEAITSGTARLVGTAEAGIVAAVQLLLHNDHAYAAMASATNPYGDGHAAERSVHALERWFATERPGTEERYGDRCAIAPR
jgi:UDP-N-acetylglucosamine 2-epimerase (non-hydrolysing)